MSNKQKGRIVILSGPSCAGKSPLDKALARFFPDLKKNLTNIVLYNSRSPRPGEIEGKDYYFRKRNQVEALRKKEHFVVMDVRGDLQGLDLEELNEILQKSNAFFEGNPFVGKTLLTHPALEKIPKTSMFMSPLSREEILYLKKPERNLDLEKFLTDVMRRKLLRRTKKQKTNLSLKDLENIEKRAGSAYRELKNAQLFDCVIPNHDGEDSENWDAFYYPVGDARKALFAVVGILRGETPDVVEKWEEDLLP